MLAIINATIIPMTDDNEILKNASIVIEDGKIKAVGNDVIIPDGAKIYDANGKYVIPGMIDAHCHSGIFADGVGGHESDGNEMTDPVTPSLRAIDAINCGDIAFDDLRAAGVTTINTGPGSANLIGGQFACIKTTKTVCIEDVILMAPSAMKMALGENPKRVYGTQKKTPSTRMANAAMLREALIEAQNYMRKIEQYETKFKEFHNDPENKAEPDAPERNLKHESLIPVLKGKLRAMIHCHRADDILTAIRIAEEFGMHYSIEHCTEGYKIADILAKKKIACVTGPILHSRSKFELRDSTPKNPAILSKAGALVVIQTDEMSAVQYIRINAGLAVQYGMAEMEALKAITIYPARTIGVADRVGFILCSKLLHAIN